MVCFSSRWARQFRHGRAAHLNQGAVPLSTPSRFIILLAVEFRSANCYPGNKVLFFLAKGGEI
jgi:hypothetical protein